jgi:hypothetical protein
MEVTAVLHVNYHAMFSAVKERKKMRDMAVKSFASTA